MLDESFKPSTTFNDSISPSLIILVLISTKIQVKVNGSCLRRDKLTVSHKTVVNSYTVSEVNLRPFRQSAGLQEQIS